MKRTPTKTRQFRLGVYDVCEPDQKPHYIGRIYRDNDYDRRVIRGAIREYSRAVRKRRGCSFVMAAFPA